jgi:hypothetical protein
VARKLALRGLAATAGGGLIAMTMAACYGGADDTYYEPYCSSPSSDADGDGYCLEYDCLETDSSVHAFATDPVGDMIDQNCDGTDGVAPDGG